MAQVANTIRYFKIYFFVLLKSFFKKMTSIHMMFLFLNSVTGIFIVILTLISRYKFKKKLVVICNYLI